MTNNLRNLLNKNSERNFATRAGNDMHARLQHVVIDDNNTRGAPDIVAQIISHPDLIKFFAPAAQTEVPIAGHINGKFISRRIDRMLIDDVTQTIFIIDYKTDISKTALREKYIAQMNEYATLMREIYPNHTIRRILLWTHDWTAEEIY